MIDECVESLTLNKNNVEINYINREQFSPYGDLTGRWVANLGGIVAEGGGS